MERRDNVSEAKNTIIKYMNFIVKIWSTG
jgi:hypothetical protein